MFRLPERGGGSGSGGRFRIKSDTAGEAETPPAPTPAREPASEAYLRAKETHEGKLHTIAESYKSLIGIQSGKVEEEISNYETLKAAERREPVFWRAPFSWIYWLLLAGLAVAEVPVNRLSFELFFAEDPRTLLIVAVLVGVILMALAHPTGIIMRRFRHSSQAPGGAASAVARLVVLIALILALCYGISIFRQAFLALQSTPDPTFANMVTTENYFEAAAHAWALNPMLEVVGWIFLAINLGIVCVGVFVSFYRHDPHPSFEQLHKDKESAERELKLLITKRDQELTAERDRFNAERRRKGW